MTSKPGDETGTITTTKTTVKNTTTNTFTNTKGTKGTKGTKYYYKARVLVYDGKTLVAKSALKQRSYGSRIWSK